MNFLRIRNINACIFEWSTPYARGSKNRKKYFFAAKAIGITTFALPHGCNIFVNSDVTEGYRKKLQKVIKLIRKTLRILIILFSESYKKRWMVKWGFHSGKNTSMGSLRFNQVV